MDITTREQEMAKERMNYTESELREAVEAFFDGSLSQADTAALFHAANLFEKCAISVTDSRLAADLHSIHLLGEYSQKALESIETAFTPEIEERLNRHVARLGAGSSHKGLWLKWGSAAACVALLISAGVHFFANDPAPTASTERILIAAAHHDSAADETEQTSILIPDNIADRKAPVAASGFSTPTTVRTVGKPKSAPRRMTTLISADRIPETIMPALTAAVNVPDRLSVPNPQTLTAMAQEAEISQLISSPLSAISKTFDTMRESLNIVNATIYEAHKSTVTLSEAFIEASSAPLRSI